MTFFGSLKGDIDNEVVVWRNYVYFFLKLLYREGKEKIIGFSLIFIKGLKFSSKLIGIIYLFIYLNLVYKIVMCYVFEHARSTYFFKDINRVEENYIKKNMFFCISRDITILLIKSEEISKSRKFTYKYLCWRQ